MMAARMGRYCPIGRRLRSATIPARTEETSQGNQRPLREGGNGHTWEGRRGAARAAAGPARSERDLVVVQCHRACSRQGPPYQVRAADQRDARLRENVSGKLTARANRRGAPNPPLHAAGVAAVGEHHVAGGRERASSLKHPDGTGVAEPVEGECSRQTGR